MQLPTVAANPTRRVVYALIAGVVLFVGAVAVYSHERSPVGEYRITASVVSGCGNPDFLRVAGKTWVPVGPAPAQWGDTFTGTFRVTSPHHADLLGDLGGAESFVSYATGKNSFSSGNCFIR